MSEGKKYYWEEKHTSARSGRLAMREKKWKRNFTLYKEENFDIKCREKQMKVKRKEGSNIKVKSPFLYSAYAYYIQHQVICIIVSLTFLTSQLFIHPRPNTSQSIVTQQ